MRAEVISKALNAGQRAAALRAAHHTPLSGRPNQPVPMSTVPGHFHKRTTKLCMTMRNETSEHYELQTVQKARGIFPSEQSTSTPRLHVKATVAVPSTQPQYPSYRNHGPQPSSASTSHQRTPGHLQCASLILSKPHGNSLGRLPCRNLPPQKVLGSSPCTEMHPQKKSRPFPLRSSTRFSLLGREVDLVVRNTVSRTCLVAGTRAGRPETARA